MADPHRIRTKRLELLPLGLADTAALHELWTEPSVREFLWDGDSQTREGVRGILGRNEAFFEELGYGMWALRRKGRNKPELLGFCGFWPFHEPAEWQILYALAPEQRGQGLATEALRALVRHAFGELGFDQVLASADAQNASSLAVMERAGMHLDRRVEILGRDTVYYVIDSSN